MRKWTFEYRPLSSCTRRDVPGFLKKCRDSIDLRATMAAEMYDNPPRVVATAVDPDPKKHEDGWSGTRINGQLHEKPFPGLRVSRISVEYDNARLPIGSKWEMDLRNGEWLNGEVPYYYVNLDYDPCVYISPLITCFPSKKMVTVSLEIGDKFALDFYRLAFLEAQHHIERIMFQARAARQLIQAFRQEPRNDGFVQRSIRELYATIGRY